MRICKIRKKISLGYSQLFPKLESKEKNLDALVEKFNFKYF